MSKLSQLQAELMEQASEMGYESLKEAELDGWYVDFKRGELIRPDPLTRAHEALMQEKKDILTKLQDLKLRSQYDETLRIEIAKFIEDNVR